MNQNLRKTLKLKVTYYLLLPKTLHKFRDAGITSRSSQITPGVVIYLCKIISRKRGNFWFLGTENQPFWLLLTARRSGKTVIIYVFIYDYLACIYVRLSRASEEFIF